MPAPHPVTLYPVQYLRAAAALVVMLFHVSVLSQETWGLDPRRVDYVGAAGVDLFFVISGFIMAMIVDRPGRFDGRDFWVRRVARVAPAYWIITCFVFVLAVAAPSLFNSTTADIAALVASLLFLRGRHRQRLDSAAARCRLDAELRGLVLRHRRRHRRTVCRPGGYWARQR